MSTCFDGAGYHRYDRHEDCGNDVENGEYEIHFDGPCQFGLFPPQPGKA
jgi:hypothetical protein